MLSWFFYLVLDWSITELSGSFVFLNLLMTVLLLNDQSKSGKSRDDLYPDTPFYKRDISVVILGIVAIIFWMIGILTPGFSWLIWNSLAVFTTGFAFLEAVKLSRISKKRKEEEFW